MTAPTPPAPGRLSLARRVAFRGAVLYFAAYALFNGNVATLPLALLGAPGRVPDWYDRATQHVVSAVATALDIRGPVRAFDNGDGVGDHLLLLCFVAFAALGAAVWSVLDRDRPDYRSGLELLRVAVRYVLVTILFAYAVFKVFPAQFSVPGPARAFQTYGTSSPMELLWTFMGYSPAYQRLAGWLEMAACALLLSRRTATLGALVAGGTLANVALLDLLFDVPAKLCVLHLLLMVAFLLAPAMRRLVDALVLQRAVDAVDVGPPPGRARLAAKAAFVAAIVVFEGLPVARYYYAARDGSPTGPFFGAYDVEAMSADGHAVEPSFIGAAGCWRHVALDRRRAVAVLDDGSYVRFEMPPPPDGAATLARGSDRLAVRKDDDGRIEITGTLDGHALLVRAHPTDPRNERLMRARFRWFNMDPE